MFMVGCVCRADDLLVGQLGQRLALKAAIEC